MSRARARIVAALAVCIVLGVSSWPADIRNHGMGKESYLASQAKHFDALYASLHLGTHFFVVGLLLGGAILGGYELLALGIHAAFRPRKPKPNVADAASHVTAPNNALQRTRCARR